MPGEAVRRQQDEDTAIGFQGHITNQADQEPEQNPQDDMRRNSEPERAPNRTSKRNDRKGKKHNPKNRK